MRGIALCSAEIFSSYMKPYRDLWQELCSTQNLQRAFTKARKHKTLKPCVLEFEADVKNNLSQLRTELLFHFYQPRPLETFILRDPKTRKISKSHFRDRVIHHALCNVIEPMFEKRFIFDSYANRKSKGTLEAIKRFEYFQGKVSHNYTTNVYVLKADIKHYFDEVDHSVLLDIIQKRVKDPKIIWLIKRILGNYSTSDGKGMPLGNLTSQFFANIYLNELDYFVKQELNAKYYLRYVDDFVIFHTSLTVLQEWKEDIAQFLAEKLKLQLHPDKSKIIPLNRGIEFLGFKLFSYHRLLKRKNMRYFLRKLRQTNSLYQEEKMTYDDVYNFMEGWCAHAKNANTFKRRQKILTSFEEQYPREISTKEVNRGLPKNKKPTKEVVTPPNTTKP
nr:hypothetical protein [uncultured archaeon]